MSRSPFICETCRDIAREPSRRIVISRDYMTADGGTRVRRITQQRVCLTCAVIDIERHESTQRKEP